ncbi:MAG TPA: GreA/GreB family elongation factor [Candidatus Paceibacterota bacterium]|nr:GreA/GreB family elongation factor [Candidatus Paceibacterota bacterium]
MKVYVSVGHLSRLQQELAEANASLSELREERALACEVSTCASQNGLYLDQLAVQEGDLVNKVARIRQTISAAEVYTTTARNIKEVRLGSIACFMRRKGREKMKLVWEIVGSDETDLRQNRVSYDNPLVTKLIGMTLGDAKEVGTPAGTVEYELIGLYPDWDAAQKSTAPVKMAAAAK